MKTILSRLLLTALVGCATSASAQATKPVTDANQTVYDTLYREKLAAVKRTRTTADDLELAQDMMAFAKDVPEDPGVQCLIYIEVIPLSTAGSDIALMQEGAAKLRKLWPEHPAAAQQNVLDLANRVYRSAQRSERKVIGEQYIDLLRNLAMRSEIEQDIDQAVARCRTAIAIARAIKSPKRKRIEQTLEHLADKAALNNRIEKLAASVSKNPQNSPAARELVDLLLTRRNDPSSAAQYVDSTQDNELAELVKLSAAGIDQADAPAAMRVGDWYVALAAEQPDQYAQPLMQNAMDWYEHFFTVYTRKDALAKRVDLAKQAAKKRLTSLNQSLAQTTGENWIDLINNRFDPDKQVVDGQVSVEGSEITAKDCNLLLPIDLKSSYELQTTFSIHTATDQYAESVMFYVPLGDHFTRIKYTWYGTKIAWMEPIRAYYEIEDRGEVLNNKTVVRLQIANHNNGQAEVVMFINGKQAVRWKGKTASLESADQLKLPRGSERYIRIRCKGEITLHKIERRTLQAD